MAENKVPIEPKPPRRTLTYIIVVAFLIVIMLIVIIWLATMRGQGQAATSTTTTTIMMTSTTIAATSSLSTWTVDKLTSVIRENTPIHFVRDSTALLPGEKEKIEAIAEALSHYKNVQLRFRGHTADFNLKRFQYQLSVLRASGVRWMLEYRSGDSISSVTIQGLGSREMISLGNSESARAPNRRVEIILQNAELL